MKYLRKRFQFQIDVTIRTVLRLFYLSQPSGDNQEKTYLGHLETRGVVRCPLPPIEELTSKAVTYKYEVEISNDGFEYSEPLQQNVLVWDSKCLDCADDVCTQKVRRIIQCQKGTLSGFPNVSLCVHCYRGFLYRIKHF